jgi:SulP family sulfate permease
MPVAFTIAILGAIESLLSATVADGVISDKHDSNTELIAQGVANIVSPLFGGIPATGAIARTMTNINNGGRSPIAGIIHAVVLLLILLFLAPLTKHIPMACLAGVLVMVSYNMFGVRTVKSMFNNPKSDISVLVLTFLLTVLFNLTIAIEIGLLLAIVLFLRRVSESVDISVARDHLDIAQGSETVTREELDIPHEVEVYEINGPFFFGVATKFDEMMMNIKDKPQVRIIRMRKVPFIDSTGVNNLKNLCERTRKRGVTVILSGVTDQVLATLQKFGVDQEIGAENIFPHIVPALEKAEELVK